MLAGLELGDTPNDDIQFVIDLGLCIMHPQGGLTNCQSNLSRSYSPCLV